MGALYIACAAFGGVLILASILLGHGHGDVGGGDMGGGGDPDLNHASQLGQGAGDLGLATLLNFRFWIFALTFFGLTGAVLHGLGGTGARVAAPFVGGVMGLAAGVVASRVLATLGGDAAGRIAPFASYVGREGLLLLPVSKQSRGKLRMRIGATEVDLLAETDDDDPLPLGASVLVSAVRGQVVVVTKNPAPAAKN